jgi:ABC-type glycerol-3-phosphate transport system substrate-binding protein
MLGPMRRPVLVAVLASLGLAACGGSSTSSSSSASSTTPATVTTNAATVTATPSSGTATTQTSTSAANAPDTNVRLPAKFTVRAGGVLVPPVIAAPKDTEVALTITAGDGKRHVVALDTPRHYTLIVHPGGPSKLVLRGVPNGTYAVRVDGASRGRLIIGAAPGP